MADPQLIRIHEVQERKGFLRPVELENGQVGLLVDADDLDGFGVFFVIIDLAVRGLDFQIFVVLDDVEVGDQKTVGADQNAGALAHGFGTRLRRLPALALLPRIALTRIALRRPVLIRIRPPEELKKVLRIKLFPTARRKNLPRPGGLPVGDDDDRRLGLVHDFGKGIFEMLGRRQSRTGRRLGRKDGQLRDA